MHPRLLLRTSAAIAALALLPLALTASQPAAAADRAERLGPCKDLDSGRIQAPGREDATVAEAPRGLVITSYCVRSSGIKEGTGAPYYVTLERPVSSVVLDHPDGGNLLHYSLAYAEENADLPVDEPTDPDDPGDEPTTPGKDFDWDWTYADPSCTALTVDYPKDLPADQSNDVNIRLRTDEGPLTLNYHLDQGTWSGTVGFTYSQHRNWPREVTKWSVSWVQVAGTNYHWTGDVSCVADADDSPEVIDIPRQVSRVHGFATKKIRVKRGHAPRSDAVEVIAAGYDKVTLERKIEDRWRKVSTFDVNVKGRAKIDFPKLNKEGTKRFRLRVARSDSVTGVLTRALAVRVE